MPAKPPAEKKKQETGYDDAYLTFARTLRTWFVAYGIGAPVLILNQTKLYDALVKSGQAKSLARLFLAGVVVQIATAIVYKAAMWYLYRAEYDPSVKKRLLFPFLDWLSEAFWVEFTLDVLTVYFFAAATWRLLTIAG